MKFAKDAETIINKIGAKRILSFYQKNKVKKIYVRPVPSQKMIKHFGLDDAQFLSDLFGGNSVNIPVKRLELYLRNKAIYKMKTMGINVKWIADFYTICPQTIYKIIASQKYLEKQKSAKGARNACIQS